MIESGRLSMAIAMVIAVGLAAIACTNRGDADGISSSAIAKGNPAAGSSDAPAALASTAGDAVTIKVYKDPNCGCCKEWMKHLEQHGFKVESMDMPDLSMLKEKHGVRQDLQACHTAIVNGYVVEGHVPADVIQKLLREKPAIVGLAVPGMPMGSPGMEGSTKERYDVLTFDRAGRTSVYAER